MTDLPPKEEAKETTPPEGSESETDLEQVISDLFPEDKEEKKDEFLAQINKIEGRNYKSIDDYAKTVKERSKAFSEQGRKAKEEKKEEPKSKDTSVSPVIKNLYFKANPEAQSVWDDLVVPEAKRLGKDPFELYETSKYLKGEAKVRFEEAEEKDKNGKKVAKPSSKISGKGGGEAELTDADRALLNRRPGLMEKYNKKYNK